MVVFITPHAVRCGQIYHYSSHGKHLEPPNEDLYSNKVKRLPWPQGTSAPISVVKSSFGAKFRMEDWRNTIMAAQFFLEPMVTSEMLKFVVLLVRTNATIRSGMTKNELEKSQKNITKIIRKGIGLFGEEWACTSTLTPTHSYTHAHTHTARTRPHTHTHASVGRGWGRRRQNTNVLQISLLITSVTDRI